jgi:hypothetical protein
MAEHPGRRWHHKAGSRVEPGVLSTRRILLFLAVLVSKMPANDGRKPGPVSKGTFSEQFSFHSWQAEMDCHGFFQREAGSQTRLAP